MIGSSLILGGCGSNPSPERAGADATSSSTPSVKVVPVVAQVLNRESRLPADLLAYRDVLIYPKVDGFIDWIGVDRGSHVKRGQLLIKMSAPELSAQTKQGMSQATAASEDVGQVRQELAVVKQQLEAARAKAKASADTYDRYKSASAYPGIIAGNDLEIAQKTAEGDAANVKALENKVSALIAQSESFESKHKAALQAARSTGEIESYLNIPAAFDGVISERNVHEGSFVHPPTADTTSKPLLRLQQLSLLRLVVPVPETDVAGIVPGATVPFSVSAFPGETFEGVVKRIADSVDVGTRTMAVEMDVDPQNRLTPGMFAEVIWPIRRSQATLFVPESAIVKTTERTFVVRIKNGIADWVDVKPGFSSGELREVFGPLQPGDEVAVRGTDELRAGTSVSALEQTTK